MPEVHESWSNERINERLRRLTQMRAAAVLERDRIAGGAPEAPPAAPRTAGRTAVHEPSPEAAAGQGGPEAVAEPSWRGDDRSDLPAEDLLSALEAPEGDFAGRPGEMADLSALLGDLIGSGLVPEGSGGAPEEGGGLPEDGLRPPLPPLYVTAHRSDAAAPASPRERAERLAEVEAEIEQLEQRIAEVRRVLARRYANEGAAKFEQVRVRLEAMVPTGAEAQRSFSADRFVEANRAELLNARALAAGVGRLFPDRALDFRGLPRAMRERLIRRISEL